MAMAARAGVPISWCRGRRCSADHGSESDSNAIIPFTPNPDSIRYSGNVQPKAAGEKELSQKFQVRNRKLAGIIRAIPMKRGPAGAAHRGRIAGATPRARIIPCLRKSVALAAAGGARVPSLAGNSNPDMRPLFRWSGRSTPKNISHLRASDVSCPQHLYK